MQHGKLPGYNSIGWRASPGKFPGIPLKGLMVRNSSTWSCLWITDSAASIMLVP